MQPRAADSRESPTRCSCFIRERTPAARPLDTDRICAIIRAARRRILIYGISSNMSNKRIKRAAGILSPLHRARSINLERFSKVRYFVARI